MVLILDQYLEPIPNRNNINRMEITNAWRYSILQHMRIIVWLLYNHLMQGRYSWDLLYAIWNIKIYLVESRIIFLCNLQYSNWFGWIKRWDIALLMLRKCDHPFVKPHGRKKEEYKNNILNAKVLSKQKH